MRSIKCSHVYLDSALQTYCTVYCTIFHTTDISDQRNSYNLWDSAFTDSLYCILQEFFQTTDISQTKEIGAMPRSAELRLCAMRHSTESIFVVESNRITPRIRIYMQNRFSPWIRGPRGTVWRKKQRSKISWDCPFKVQSSYGLNHGHALLRMS
jgi:hypothetical protein